MIIILMLSIIVSFACCHKNAPTTSGTSKRTTQVTVADLVSPEQGTVFTWGDSVNFNLDFRIPVTEIDSVRILSKNNSKTYADGFGNLYWQTIGCRVGQNTVRLSIHYRDSMVESHTLGLVLLSDIIPEHYNYRVVNTFPHDDEAYTQGLLYHNGYLYESTGLEGKSTIRIVDIASGVPEKTITLNPDIFAEGIAIFNEQIYQITWRSRIGYIYNINTLEQIRSFDYQNNEGWGLTSDTKNLIMSDGSENLYIIEPEFFTQIDQFDIFDHRGRVSNLNEMEYVNNKILANVYGETYIVIIDAETGKVTGLLDLDDIMPDGTKGDMARVLNGIAYNPQTGHLYVTGKNWPVLYEIMVTPSL